MFALPSFSIEDKELDKVTRTGTQMFRSIISRPECNFRGILQFSLGSHEVMVSPQPKAGVDGTVRTDVNTDLR